MTTPPEGAGLRAIINQIPPAMEASLVVLHQVAKLGRVSPQQSPEHLYGLVMDLHAILIDGVITLDNRIERLEGRPGIPAGLIGSVLSEFNPDE